MSIFGKTHINDAAYNGENIYLDNDRRNEPKEIFKTMGDIIESFDLGPSFSLVDVGCACGDFVFYLKERFPSCGLYGLDVSERMIEVARKNVKDATFYVGSIDDENSLPARSFDIITCSGVLSIFDDPTPPIINCLSAVKSGGRMILASVFNDDPVDVVVRFRRTDSEDAQWEKGWNVFSCRTMERILKESGYKTSTSWKDFRMPFPIEKSGDPMRTWTTHFGNEPHFLVNGALQLIDLKILEILVHDVP